VITFRHGEILVCPEIAKKQARQFGRKTADETLLYGIHGILHLVGYADKTPVAFKKMFAAQEKLLAAVLDQDGKILRRESTEA
jgi:probable rRNA maturation factor